MPCYAPVFEPRSPIECFLRWIRNIILITLLILFAWIPAIHCFLLQLLFEIRRCRFGNREPNLDLDFDPNAWLGQVNFSSEVIWEQPNGVLHPHNLWTSAERGDLQDAFWNARLDEDLGIPEAPPEAAPAATGRPEGTAYTPALAWRIFIAYVAQTIAVEHARGVAWALSSLTQNERAIFFDSRSFFRPVAGLYEPTYLDGERITYGDPVRTVRFLRGLGVLGPDSLTVIHRLLEWAHANMRHYLGGPDPANCIDHWGYGGNPPCAVVISGRIRVSDGTFGHWSAGCWGLTAFMRAVLRTANIGVAQFIGGGHSQPQFVRDDRFLTHGDDPYNQLTFTTPAYPMSLLPIAGPQHTAWFGPAVPPADAGRNVGRRVIELAVDHPESLYLMRQRCADIAAGLSHATSTVFSTFSNFYTVADLEARTLWDRIDAAIAARGGCRSL